MPKTSRGGGGKTLTYLLAGVFVLFVGSTWAANVYWTGAVNNYWDEPGNWEGQHKDRPLPTNDDAFFTNSGTYTNNEVVFTNFCENAYRTYVRNVGTAENPLVFRAMGSDCGLMFGTNGWYNYYSGIGDSQGNTYLRLVNGTWEASFLFVGKNSSDNGYLELKDINTFTISKALEVLNGTMILDGGSITLQGGDWSRIGNGSGTKADFIIEKGSVTISGSNNTSALYIGNGSGGSRDAVTMTVKKGGSFTATGSENALCVGRGSPGTLNIEGGTVELWNLNFCYEDGGADSVANITEGGVLYTDRIKVVRTSKAATLNIDGGKIKPRNNDSLFGAAYTGLHVYVGAKGAEFDGSGMLNNKTGYTILEDIEDKSGESGVVKFTGGKTVTLSGKNTYKGGTVIELGTKVIAGTEEAKNAVVNNLVVDGGKYFADTGDIIVFEYSAGGLSLDNINVSFINCGGGTMARVSDDGKKILVDFFARQWATVNKNISWTELVDLVKAAGGEAPASDAIVSIKMDGDHTLTIDDNVTVGQLVFFTAGGSASGSTLVVKGDKTLSVKGIEGIGIVEVQEGAIVSVDSISGVNSILNDGRFVKTGDGTLTFPFNKGYAAKGVTVVSCGTLVASEKGSGTNCHKVHVNSGAKFDIHGSSVSFDVTLEDGACFVNDGNEIPSNYQQVNKITLEGDAAVTASKPFGMLAPSYNETCIDLGENTLSVKGSGQFWLVNTTINGEGTVAVEENGVLYVTTKDVKGDECTVRIGSKGGSKGKLAVGAKMTVRNFINANAERIWGNGTLKVTGLFTLGETKIETSMELGDGATIKVTGTTPQEVSSAFSASGTIKVDTSEIPADKFASAENGENVLIPVLTIPQNSYDSCKEAFWQISGIDASMRSLRWRQNGNNMTLYVVRPGGTKIIIR